MESKSEIEILKTLTSAIGKEAAEAVIDYVNTAIDRSVERLKTELERKMEMKYEPKLIKYGSTPKMRY
jgi:hypothetical protein